jgi:uncharacterized protein (TIGR02722 family)
MKPLIPAIAAAAALTFAGCGTQQPPVQVLNTMDSPQMVTTMNKMDLQDWKVLAQEMINSMLGSGALDNAPEQPARIVVTRVRNDTMSSQNLDVLTNEILVALTESGKVRASASYGTGGNVADQGTRDIVAEREGSEELMQKMEGTYDAGDAIRKTVSRTPYFTLSGSIKQDISQDGRVRQNAYVLVLRLAETATGDIVWQNQLPIVKQTTTRRVGL